MVCLLQVQDHVAVLTLETQLTLLSCGHLSSASRYKNIAVGECIVDAFPELIGDCVGPANVSKDN